MYMAIKVAKVNNIKTNWLTLLVIMPICMPDVLLMCRQRERKVDCPKFWCIPMVMTYSAHCIKITRLVSSICEKAYQMTCTVIDIVSLFQVVNKLDRILLARDK